MRTREIIAGGLVAGTAAVALCLALSGGTQKIDLAPYDALGAVTAQETAMLLANKGQVLVLARDTGQDKNPSVEAELRAFQETLKSRPGLGVVIERVRVTPMLMMATGGGLPPGQLFKALETHSNAGAVVLFFAFPELTGPEAETLKKMGLKVVVVSSLRPGYKQLLERQAIHLAIVPRPDAPPPGTPPPRTLRERFDQEFTVLTPADAARLP